MANIFGLTIDNNSRCIHYGSLVDVIANKCYFCRKYYACFHCHDELEEHRFMPWPNSDVSKAKVVLCGVCQNEMTAKEYKEQTECLNCGHLFNPNCSRHASIYFN
ncbi:CHY zinc finger protein [Enterococcus sp. DIV0724b]|uniref:CHY zinc finger protein n=1 Tax=Enterococcus sp. DIV0724b TaxID=2774694 RepID=UPI003D2FCF36